MKLSFGMRLRDEAFGGGNQFGRALVKALSQAGYHVSFDLKAPDLDLILLADPRPELQITAYTHHDVLRYLRHVNPRARVVYRVNDSDERKGERNVLNPLIRQAGKVADAVVWVSAWLREIHLAQGMQTRLERVILNGADEDIFHPHGYQLWDRRAPLRLVTHHWGGLWSKGFDVYQYVDGLLDAEKYRGRLAFTYIGNVPQDFRFQHAAYSPPLSGQALGEALRAHHVYITGAQYEPSGNHHMEGAACGLPLLYRASGGSPEYCRGFGLPFESLAEFESALDRMLAEYETWAAKMPAYPHRSSRMVADYLALFEEVLRMPDSPPRLWQAVLPAQNSKSGQALAWLHGLKPSLSSYWQTLRGSEQSGHFRPVHHQLEKVGAAIRLPWSALALKTAYMLGDWEKLAIDEQNTWLDFIRAYQTPGNPLRLAWGKGAFLDRPLIQEISWQTRRLQRLRERLISPRHLNRVQAALSAETKQALATLAEVGSDALYPYQGFPTTPAALRRYLQSLDWTQPWGAGAHFATLSVFIRRAAPRFLSAPKVESLAEVCRVFAAHLVDEETGAYFKGPLPEHGELVNGAMKILTGLAWLELAPHRPETLIDTVLRQPPSSEGCHLVDALYVLYECAQHTKHRRPDIENYMLATVDMLAEHYNPLDGGFSYHAGRAQTHFYGVQFAPPQATSDLHGTTLLTWASALILHFMGEGEGWHLIKP
jgi:hypothetical protein